MSPKREADSSPEQEFATPAIHGIEPLSVEATPYFSPLSVSPMSVSPSYSPMDISPSPARNYRRAPKRKARENVSYKIYFSSDDEDEEPKKKKRAPKS